MIANVPKGKRSNVTNEGMNEVTFNNDIATGGLVVSVGCCLRNWNAALNDYLIWSYDTNKIA